MKNEEEAKPDLELNIGSEKEQKLLQVKIGQQIKISAKESPATGYT